MVVECFWMRESNRNAEVGLSALPEALRRMRMIRYSEIKYYETLYELFAKQFEIGRFDEGA